MSTKDKEYIEQFYDHGIYLPTKTLKLTGPVDEDMLNSAMCGLHILDSTTSEITIKLSSEGGCVTTAKAIYDLIRGCKNRVRIIGYGEVASAGSIILQAGDLRVLSTNAELMIHVGSEGIPQDHPRNVDVVYNKHRSDEKWMEDIYLKKIKEVKKRYTRNQLKSMLTWDRYMSPKEALEFGLIDEIGEIQ